MKVLVTGGLGVIGQVVVKHILDNPNNKVVIVDAAEEPRNHWTAKRLLNHFNERIEIHYKRLESFQELPTILKDTDQIIHAAAHTGIPHSVQDPSDDWMSNVDATRFLLENMRQTNSHIPTVIMSSVKPYKINHLNYSIKGNRYVYDDIVGVNEHFPVEPDVQYAASKLAQSGLAQSYAFSYGLPIVTIRFSNLYGPAPCHGPRHGWLTWFCISAVIGKTIEIQGTGLQTRDMLYSDDVVSALEMSLKYIGVTTSNIYNVGGGANNAISINEAVDYIRSKVDVDDVSIKRGPARKNDDPIFITDYFRFNRDTGWIPKIGVHNGIDKVLSWATVNAAELKILYEKV